jgi:hypothetical protein
MRSGFISSHNSQNQLFDPGEVVKPVAKRDRFSRKLMPCVWCIFEGVNHFELMPNNRAIDAELYSA